MLMPQLHIWLVASVIDEVYDHDIPIVTNGIKAIIEKVFIKL